MRQPRAFIVIRPGLHYRLDAFSDGLKRLGYTVQPRPPQDHEIETDTVLVTWNRTGFSGPPADLVERFGGRVIVSENGYLGKDENGHQLYSMALGHHNGAGHWPNGGPERWDALGIPLKPWRESGKHLLILGQRGIGESGVAMPMGWDRNLWGQLRRRSDRPVKFRPHPGKSGVHGIPPVLLKHDLKDCYAALTWNSGAALRALIAGIPVFHGHVKWIGAPAAKPIDAMFEKPFLGDRLPMLHRLAWAQWKLTEISSGEAFKCLLA